MSTFPYMKRWENVTHEDMHVSEPVSAFVAEMARAVADLPTLLERVRALRGLMMEGYDAAAIEHNMHLELVQRAVIALNKR